MHGNNERQVSISGTLADDADEVLAGYFFEEGREREETGEVAGYYWRGN